MAQDPDTESQWASAGPGEHRRRRRQGGIRSSSLAGHLGRPGQPLQITLLHTHVQDLPPEMRHEDVQLAIHGQRVGVELLAVS